MSVDMHRKYFLEKKPVVGGEWTRWHKFSTRHEELATLAVIFAATLPQYIYRIVERRGLTEHVLSVYPADADRA